MPSHMIEGFIEGLMARRPALFNLYTSCQPEHGIGDDMGEHQAKLAVESRAYPLFRYDPEKGATPAECFDLAGNPAMDRLWPEYELSYQDGARTKTMRLPMTFADFAITETRFRKHFRSAPPDTWNDKMVPLAEFLELTPDERDGRFPFIWTVDRKQRLSRLLVDAAMVRSCEDRRDFWTLLNSLAGTDRHETTTADIERRVRQEVVARIAGGLAAFADPDTPPGAVPTLAAATFDGDGTARAAAGSATDADGSNAATAGDDGYMAPWLDSDECTACDECMKINPAMFAYNASKKAEIINPDAGPYSDLVKAAEKCTAQVIHPGLPRERGTGDVDKWITRGEKYN
jgi:pyruvate-ferredoxin/flavodoxin oxidoreductase